MLEMIILGFLMRHPASGYDLKQYMAKTTSYFFDASYGSIYPALKRMAEKGHIRPEEQVEKGKFKKLYSITEEGRDHFLEWLNQPVRFSRTRLEHLVPFFFYEYLDQETAARNFKAFIQETRVCLDDLEDQKMELDRSCPDAAGTYRYCVLVYGIQYYQTLIEWCSRLCAVAGAGAVADTGAASLFPKTSQEGGFLL